jgi:hypothetical protein
VAMSAVLTAPLRRSPQSRARCAVMELEQPVRGLFARSDLRTGCGEPNLSTYARLKARIATAIRLGGAATNHCPHALARLQPPWFSGSRASAARLAH